MPKGLIEIGETLHASIQRPGKAMKELRALGNKAYSQPSEALDYIKELIVSQADEGADYIALNVDEFGEDDPAVAVDLMVEYVKLVRKCEIVCAIFKK